VENLLGPLAQLAQQPRILDGDDGLGGEVLDKGDLLFSKYLDFCPVDLDDTEQLLLLEHRDAQHSACTGESNNRRLHGIGYVAWYLLYVGYLNHLLGLQRAGKPGASARPNERRALSGLRIFDRGAVHDHGAKCVVLAEPKIAEVGLADADGVLQHSVENRLQFAW